MVQAVLQRTAGQRWRRTDWRVTDGTRSWSARWRRDGDSSARHTNGSSDVSTWTSHYKTKIFASMWRTAGNRYAPGRGWRGKRRNLRWWERERHYAYSAASILLLLLLRFKLSSQWNQTIPISCFAHMILVITKHVKHIYTRVAISIFSQASLMWYECCHCNPGTHQQASHLYCPFIRQCNQFLSKKHQILNW